jgi:predicted esterase
MKIIFSHGKESGPWGSKIKTLATIAKQHGHHVDSIDYSNIDDPDLRVQHLLNIVGDNTDDLILVGSSMGGYVSLVASEQLKPKAIFLLAPALYMTNYKVQKHESNCQNIEIIHGWSDDVIPVENSIRFAKGANCSLHIIKGDHRLNTSINYVVEIFNSFLSSFK